MFTITVTAVRVRRELFNENSMIKKYLFLLKLNEDCRHEKSMKGLHILQFISLINHFGGGGGGGGGGFFFLQMGKGVYFFKPP